jgi:hypothetical protein
MSAAPERYERNGAKGLGRSALRMIDFCMTLLVKGVGGNALSKLASAGKRGCGRRGKQVRRHPQCARVTAFSGQLAQMGIASPWPSQTRSGTASHRVASGSIG